MRDAALLQAVAALALLLVVVLLLGSLRSVVAGAGGEPRGGVGSSSPADRDLAALRSAARQADPAGKRHYRLARALADGAVEAEIEGRGEEALALLAEGLRAGEVALERRPASSRYATLLGELHGLTARRGGVVGRMRHGRRAAELYARAVELDPGNARARVGVGIARLETPVMFGGSTAAALEAFRAAQHLDPRCEEAWIWEGIALARGGDVEAARRALGHALEINPASTHARHELANLDGSTE